MARTGVLFAYGPVMLNEALLAANLLKKESYSLKVVNMPWLNRTDPSWLNEILGDCNNVFVLDDHSPFGGLGDSLMNTITSLELRRDIKLHKFAVVGYPGCGNPKEALKHHNLDAESLVVRILGK